SRLGAEGELIDRVLGFDVELFAGGIAEDPAHRRRDHPVPVGIAEDHHTAPDARVADQVTRVAAADAERSALSTVVANLSRGDAEQVSSLGRMLAHSRQYSPSLSSSCAESRAARGAGPLCP